VPVSEQGGLSHLSARPQQVYPGFFDLERMTTEADDIILSIARLPQSRHATAISFPMSIKNSEVLPQSRQRYS